MGIGPLRRGVAVCSAAGCGLGQRGIVACAPGSRVGAARCADAFAQPLQHGADAARGGADGAARGESHGAVRGDFGRGWRGEIYAARTTASARVLPQCEVFSLPPDGLRAPRRASCASYKSARAGAEKRTREHREGGLLRGGSIRGLVAARGSGGCSQLARGVRPLVRRHPRGPAPLPALGGRGLCKSAAPVSAKATSHHRPRRAAGSRTGADAGAGASGNRAAARRLPPARGGERELAHRIERACAG